jgi:hypothetical protein
MASVVEPVGKLHFLLMAIPKPSRDSHSLRELQTVSYEECLLLESECPLWKTVMVIVHETRI